MRDIRPVSRDYSNHARDLEKRDRVGDRSARRRDGQRLRHLSDICHADEKSVAASLLHDILKDDEEAHVSPAQQSHHLH